MLVRDHNASISSRTILIAGTGEGSLMSYRIDRGLKPNPELDAHLEDIKVQKKRRERDNILNTLVTSLIGAGLAYWAWHTLAHAAFAFFLFFSVSAVANRISGELFQLRAQQKAAEIMNREGT